MRKAPDAVELTKQLVRMNTTDPPGHEEPCARYLGAILEEAGFRAEYHAFADGRVEIIRRWCLT